MIPFAVNAQRARRVLDRIVGYEANYAGTSFVKVSDIGKLKYGSKLFNVTADRTIPTGGYAPERIDEHRNTGVRDPDERGAVLDRAEAHRVRLVGLEVRPAEPRVVRDDDLESGAGVLEGAVEVEEQLFVADGRADRDGRSRSGR